MIEKGCSLSPAGGGSSSVIEKFQIGVDKKLNRITERTSEQFAWRSSKLATTSDDKNY